LARRSRASIHRERVKTLRIKYPPSSLSLHKGPELPEKCLDVADEEIGHFPAMEVPAAVELQPVLDLLSGMHLI